MPLTHVERPARDEPTGLLVLHHGRGSDEADLIALADVVDPLRRLHVTAPRAPLTLPGSPGFHWYVVPRVGYPDPTTFFDSCQRLAEFHDETWARTGLSPDRTVLGGFSMGTVMSFACAFSRDRPAPAGVMAFSGFIPTVDGWEPDFASRPNTCAFIAHGRRDPVIEIGFARAARDRLTEAGIPVDYNETNAGHEIDPGSIRPAAEWLTRAVT